MHQSQTLSLYVVATVVDAVVNAALHSVLVMYVNPKHEISLKPLVLCRTLLSSIGLFSALQAEYSAYAYSIYKQPCNRNS